MIALLHLIQQILPDSKPFRLWGVFICIMILLHFIYFAPHRQEVVSYCCRFASYNVIVFNSGGLFLLQRVSRFVTPFLGCRKCRNTSLFRVPHKISDINTGYPAAVHNVYFQENILTFLNIPISKRSANP